MRALVLEGYGEPLELAEVDRPEPDPRGAVIEVEACGICRSDWHAWQGHGEWADDRVPIGQVLGHEPAGRVIETGAHVESIGEGDRVTVPFNLGDGTCRECQAGHGNVCTDGWALGFEADAPGAFAEYVHVPRAGHNLVSLPGGVPTKAMAALGCRYATAFHALAHRADVGEGESVVVYGCGGLGLAAVAIADALGGNVVGVDVRQGPLERAIDLGATGTVNASEVEGVPARVREVTDGGAHVSVDALGRAETCRNAIESLRERGRHVQVGLTTDAERGEVSLPIDGMTRWDVSFLGSRGMPPSRYDELLGLVEDGTLDPSALLTREVALEEVSDRLAAMSDYETEGVEVVTEF